jgi:hypothetical protein
LRPSGKRLDRRGVGQILQHVEEGDDEAAAGQDRREQRRRRQILQALDEIQQDHRYQQHQEVPVHADVEEVVLDDVVEVRRNEDEVDAAEAQLGDAQEDVDQRPGDFAEPLHGLRPRLERVLHHFREVHRRLLGSSAQLVRARDQHVHAVGADKPHQHRPEQTHHPSGVPERVRHGQDSGPDVTLQEVDHRVEVRSGVFELPVEHRVLGEVFPGGHVLQVHGHVVDGIAFQQPLFLVFVAPRTLRK